MAKAVALLKDPQHKAQQLLQLQTIILNYKSLM